MTLLHPQQRTPLKQWRFEDESLIRIGRAAENHVILEDLLVSRFHLELRRVELAGSQSGRIVQWHLINHSSNGTFVDGYVMSQGILPDGATIQLAQGGPVLQFQVLTASIVSRSTTGNPPQSPLLPVLPEIGVVSPAISEKTPVCTHAGNAPGNLFCVRCGQPVRVEQTIRQYQVLRILGRGGMGTTYLVWNPEITNAAVPRAGLQVLKEMNADMVRIPKARELFEREASTLKTLNHPGIPRFYDFFVERGNKYLVMELLHGQDLEKWVRRNGPVQVGQAIAWMIQTCEILEYLHHREMPIIHRDIKPGNLLVQNLTHRIVVLDFGAVKAAGMPSRTRIGAEGYSAPEQNQGRPVTQSDLYAIGPSLVFLLTGEAPLRFLKRRGPVQKFLLEGVAAIPLPVRKVIERTTEPYAGDRYQTARELAQALAQCL
ncbi:protein kinase [Kovacikia minuta CCNUW1]|uniref:protein kinase domain-containing protein n=1 Tax=Kovacikia minuta TaxID=2931930 RepID=UPI001CCB726A|nr:protein kinase [Kovacikia minuta]UBF29472.1 protein kinase [Kovacikia minuta CCNUW1]